MLTFDQSDVRSTSRSARLAIGFAESPSDWIDAMAEFSEGRLSILGHPVMEDWETPYMRRLAGIVATRGGTVLEVGFGMGISARYVQREFVGRHIVIEANRDVFRCVEEFAQRAPGLIVPVFGFWQDVLPTIEDESVDGILFDTYPLNDEEVHCNHFPFFEHAHRILKKGGVLTYYSDEISDFSPAHRTSLLTAGFTDIKHEVCPVRPPDTCVYWHSQTIIAPIVTK